MGQRVARETICQESGRTDILACGNFLLNWRSCQSHCLRPWQKTANTIVNQIKAKMEVEPRSHRHVQPWLDPLDRSFRPRKSSSVFGITCATSRQRLVGNEATITHFTSPADSSLDSTFRKRKRIHCLQTGIRLANRLGPKLNSGTNSVTPHGDPVSAVSFYDHLLQTGLRSRQTQYRRFMGLQIHSV